MTKIILSALFILASIGIFFGFVSTTYTMTQATAAEVSRYDAALSKAREVQELKNSLLSRFNNFAGENTVRLEKLLPDNVDNVRLILDLDGIASRYGLRIQNVAVQSTEVVASRNTASVISSLDAQARPYESLLIQFDVISSYEDFLALLADLESSLRIVDIATLTMDQGPTVVDQAGNIIETDDYQFSVSLRTYWLKEDN